MPRIGSHVSFSDKGLLHAAQEAITYGSSTFMIYTGAPQNTHRKPIESQYISEGTQLMHQHGIEEIIVHAPYIINLASYKPEIFKLAVEFLQEEIRRTSYIGVKHIVVHPGAYTDKDAVFGINRIIEGLNEVLAATKDTHVHIALETMAGKGTELGRSFEELAAIIDGVTDNARLQVCLDTCHIHDAGYDLVGDLDGVIQQFDRLVGIDRLAVIHLNDSKNARGASKDRHTPIGSGWIGFDTIHKIVQYESFRHLPMILETPWIGKDEHTQRPMYEAEIALLTGHVLSRFGSEFIEDVHRIAHFFAKKDVHARDYVMSTWQLLKDDPKAKKIDGREPIQRLYDFISAEQLLPQLNEEQLNQRLVAWFAGVEVIS
jgi:deoxyribonuclease-4